MSKLLPLASLCIVLSLGVMLVGCSNQQPAAGPDAAQDEAESGDHEGHDHGDHDHGDHDHGDHDQAGNGQYEDALSELSPADRELAEKQKVCPVSDQPLGSMGKPIKVTVEGQDVLLCCSACESQIKENPEKYLAKLSD
ncbi:MAG: hypothetical protein ACODAD_08720 [Planctomycetota bacterium]